ncbi:MAG TPA: hypothetical protein P5528_02545 [Steroidobacteraceae bacterium]|nr:hypothetical protein [Steroidobacteraceae bacterium]HRX88301.1 hypothetical protein [Steroidobacteraceae bacterium]
MPKLLSLLLISALIALGCSKRSEELVTEAGIEGSGEGANATVSTEDGDMVYGIGDSPSMPADYPQDVVVLAHDKLQTALTMPGSVVISYQTQRPVAELFAAVQKGMEAQGWKQTLAEQNLGSKSSLLFSKGNRLMQYEFEPPREGAITVMQAHTVLDESEK